ncbi:interleukin-22 receptor subunit alpha-1 isoform X1 [Monodelphis domestica]|uniref:interleukin-22 receptor subunit alpha-1 isoform X1 n=1 Tax=Monodelphis domestica TaxID=13616 RepID=UPI0024E246E7|nr:interleukin-22 receptor subunit alpha-1 isoform X1 [Monodelphis domestica]
MKWLLVFLIISIPNVYNAEESPKLLQNLRFHSSNFENILKWDSIQGSPPDTVYNVQYKRYGDPKWKNKDECQNITETSCNLTYETRDTDEQYFAKVTASSRGQRNIQEWRQTPRFSACRDTLIKPPLVTCIPNVRSVRLVVHPSPTALWTSDGHSQTLEEIFPDLFYRLQLHINHTYQMHLEGKKKEYEFFGLAPDTEYQGVTTISIPTPFKESPPYTCRVRTLADRTWIYSFSGVSLFTMGFLVAVLCYLSYRYVKKPPKQPNSLDVQRVLTFQPLRFIQEHILVPAIDFSSSGGLVPPIQYSQVKVPGPREALGAPLPSGLPEITYLGQSEIPIPILLAHQALPPPSYAPQTILDVGPPSYAPQVVPETKPPTYAPQTLSDPWPPSYGACMEGSGEEISPHQDLNGTKGQPQPNQTRTGPNSQTEELQQNSRREEFFHQPPGLRKEQLPSRVLPLVHPTGPLESVAPGYLSNQISLLSSVQVEDQPFSLPSTPSLLFQPREEMGEAWSLLDSVVCPKDELSPPGPERSCLAQASPEFDRLFRDLDLTVQWEP